MKRGCQPGDATCRSGLIAACMFWGGGHMFSSCMIGFVCIVGVHLDPALFPSPVFRCDKKNAATIGAADWLREAAATAAEGLCGQQFAFFVGGSAFLVMCKLGFWLDRMGGYGWCVKSERGVGREREERREARDRATCVSAALCFVVGRSREAARDEPPVVGLVSRCRSERTNDTSVCGSPTVTHFDVSSFTGPWMG
ncbi:unnamed protein product [Hapterophycus canaliculatus]